MDLGQVRTPSGTDHCDGLVEGQEEENSNSGCPSPDTGHVRSPVKQAPTHLHQRLGTSWEPVE